MNVTEQLRQKPRENRKDFLADHCGTDSPAHLDLGKIRILS